MDVELQINNSTAPEARFVTWVPSPCRIRVTDPSGANASTVSVKIAAVSAANGGGVGFRSGTTGAFASSLTLTVPTNGTTVPFFVAGKFGQPSTNSGDVKIEARVGNTLVGSSQLMVRIRKNANKLTNGERDRFIAAFAKLNNQGLGRFADFNKMHKGPGLSQAHSAPGFLPWHRAYLLDLERELQAIDPSVALPYWRFDQPAPNVFTRDFLGESDANGTVKFRNGNPLEFWVTDGTPGINRTPDFPTSQAPPNPMKEAQTLALGNQFRTFRGMEGDPHGLAHTSFGGSIQDPRTAAKDPLFFLLHCNVDRLWAKWQRQNGRFDPATAASFDERPTSRPGHKLNDTMWPWNGITSPADPTRPPDAPGGTLATSPCVAAPGPQPRVKDCIDYLGAVNAAANAGFGYDDVQI
ncbi:tyrosinase family protein [Bradyrhizobium yuanmingense]|uniref:tyrosinase family protein n=1 Tax=Bradyrhizobium yuanmingense TaxID=108015 RepID=UPI0023B8C30F|nr:tyrosinase family protein [Bradyrhizobium yuanmingense]MDF0521703.1 tyrosinase family protein [Bradyrhizobium yuanmingense]